jgi:beta-glucanase (GH16 family)
MEHWGNNQNYVQSAMHTPSSFGNTVNHGGQMLPTASTAFHDYELIWTDENMIFSVDGIVHYIYNPPVKNNQTWPFEEDQYMLLNIAIQPSIAANFIESAMEIEYVRVYQQAPLSTPEIDKRNGFLLFPNPTKHQLTIQVEDELLGKQVAIYSILGQKMMDFELNNSQTILEIADYDSGVYFLKIDNRTLKFVKE